MNKLEREKEIRRLLGLYYEGSTSREEERRLASLFLTSDKLPEDLETDRKLFLSLAEVPDIDMPDKYDAYIAEAIDKEINKDLRRGVWRRRFIVAASVAAVLLAAWMGIKALMPDSPDAEIKPQVATITIPGQQQTALVPDTSVAYSGIALVQTTPAIPVKGKNIETHALVKEKAEKESKAKIETKASKKNTVSPKPSVLESKDETYYLSAEEERQLEADNYRVVNDEREAYAIVNSVFSRLDGNIRESNYRIGDINEQYERVAAKL